MKQEMQTLKVLSERLAALHKNVWVLDSINWDDRIRGSFFASGCKELPTVTEDYYRNRAMHSYSYLSKEFSLLALDAEKQLSDSNPLKQMFIETVTQFIDVCLMLENRGSKEFYTYSKKLYGSSNDLFDESRKLINVSESLQNKMRVKHLSILTPPEKIYSAKEARKYIQKAVDSEMGKGICQVKISDEIVADAVAGGESIKLRKDALYSEHSMNSLVVHEGLVHVATYKNGQTQESASFLSIGAPRATATQEGLAVFMEVAHFHSYPDRIKRICERMKGINLAEQGADFLEVFNYFTKEEGVPKDEAYILSSRVFRGGDPKKGGLFTKDISYVKGLLSLTQFIDDAIDNDTPEYLPALFHGKLNLEDIPALVEAENTGLIGAPSYIPKPFNDVNGLYVWYSLFQSVLDNSKK